MTFEVGAGHSVMALSHELTVEDLVAWSGALAIASAAEWIETGGEVES